MLFPIDLQNIMARTQILVKNSDFFTNGLLLVIHIIYQLLVMICKLLHHLKHPKGDVPNQSVNELITTMFVEQPLAWPGSTKQFFCLKIHIKGMGFFTLYLVR